MAYEIVCESESKRYRSDCASVLTKTCEILKSKNIIAQFSLVGSGAKNLITRNGNGPYDLDYNLVVIKADERYWKDLRLLKDTVRNALNKAERKDFFSDAMDSRSCLTTLLHFNDSPNVEFSFDVAILTKNRNGDYKKVFAEQEKYREWLLSQPPDEILNHCYEYTVREDIVLALEEYDLSDKQCKALLKSPSPLADVFKDFEKRETDHMDNIRDTIECRANAVIRADFLRDRREAR